MVTKQFTGKALILLFLLSIPSFVRLLRPGYFSMQDDVQAFRLYEFDKCVKTGQIPCRWIPDGGAGYGYPLFNYYPPLPYIVGETFHLLGLSLIDSVKLLFILGFLGAAFSMYFLVSVLWGKGAGFVSAIFYLYAPYRAVDSYVRGALGEFWALSLVPFLLLGVYLIIARKKWGEVIVVITLAALMLTHLLTVLMLLPFLVVWGVYWLFKTKNYRSILSLIKASLFGLGISAFFWLPALAEKNLVTINTITQGYFDFKGHFATLNQLFLSRFWGYGASLFGRSDMSFQIGHLQWIIPTVVMGIALLLRKKKIISDPFFYFSVILGFLYAFLAHNKSTPIWLALPFMAFLQFPWRFVGLSVLSFSVALGTVRIKSKFMLVLMTVSVILLNVGYFKEDIWYPAMTDTEKLSPQGITRQNIAGLKDYWPVSGTAFPAKQAPSVPTFTSGKGLIVSSEIGTNVGRYTIEVNRPSTLEFPVVYFPNWKAFDQVTGEEIPIKISQPLGLIAFDLPRGQSQVVLKLFDTPIRRYANLITLVSLVLFAVSQFSPHRRGLING